MEDRSKLERRKNELEQQMAEYTAKLVEYNQKQGEALRELAVLEAKLKGIAQE